MQEGNLKKSGRGPWYVWTAAAGTVGGLSVLAAAVITLQVARAEAQVAAAQAQLEGARLNLQDTQVRAPVAGRIGKLEMTPGNLVAAGRGSASLRRASSNSSWLTRPRSAQFQGTVALVRALGGGWDGPRGDTMAPATALAQGHR